MVTSVIGGWSYRFLFCLLWFTPAPTPRGLVVFDWHLPSRLTMLVKPLDGPLFIDDFDSIRMGHRDVKVWMCM